MTKTLNQIFFFLHRNQNIFFSNIGNNNIFLETPPPPRKLNWPSLSILPTISKFNERAIYEQPVTFFDKVFHPSLSAFRSGYGCQTALLKIIEDWKKALDENKFVAAIFMDLSKAFDCLRHKLLINKLDAYGVSESALKLINKKYFSNRKQCVKIGNIMSEWEDIYKGDPKVLF